MDYAVEGGALFSFQKGCVCETHVLSVVTKSKIIILAKSSRSRSQGH